MQEWIANLKPGDDIIHVGGWGASIRKVKRLTKTQVVVGDPEVKFNKETGYLVGRGRWNFSHIEEATPELMTKIKENEKRGELMDVIDNCKLTSLSTETLTKLANIIREENV